MVSYPKDWGIRTLGKCGEFISGVCFPLENQGKKTGEIPFFKVSDFNSSVNRFALLKANNYVTRVEAELLSTKFIPKYSIVFAKIGAAIKLERKRLVLQNSLIDNNMMAFVTFKDYSIDFLKWFFESVNLSDYIEVTALPSLKSSTLKKIEVWMPNSKSEQQAIADALTAFDTHISNLSKLIEKKKMIRDGAVEDLVSGKRRLAGFSGKWESKSLLDIAIILNGLTYKPEDVRPYGKLVIRSSNIKDGKLVYIDNVYVDEAKSTSEDVAIGDVIICVRNGSSAIIGKSAYVQENIDATVGAFMSNIRCHNTHLSKFFYYFTKTETFKDFINEVLGATINQITKSDLKRLKFAIPLSLSEQQAIADILTAMDKEISDLEEEKEKYIALKAGAMDDLLTGKIRLV